MAPARGAVNMALDSAFHATVKNGGDPVLRFYQWSPACISFGRNQTVCDVYDPVLARAAGIDLVRRPTGGLAVLHQYELTYAVIAPASLLGGPRNTYAAINRALVAGLRTLGVDAVMAGSAVLPTAATAADSWPATEIEPVAAHPLAAHQVAAHLAEPNLVAAYPTGTHPPGAGFSASPRPDSVQPCFRTPAVGEVMTANAKLVGSAQCCEMKTILQHGSILLDGDQGSIVAYQIRPEPVTQAGITLRTVLGSVPSTADLVRALAAGFQATLGTPLAHGTLLENERDRAAMLEEHYDSDAWTWRR